MKFTQRLLQAAIAADQLAGTIVGLFLADGAWADETLSARAYREGKHSTGWSWFRRVVDSIFFWETEHCFQSYMREIWRFQLPPEMRVAGEEIA